jgi:hypothetical protein
MRFFTALLVIFALAACDTAAPATTPATGIVPTAVETGGNDGTDELTQTATSEDGSLTVRYPTGWFVNAGINQITLANNDAMLSSFNDPSATPETDQIAISIVAAFANQLPPGADGQPMNIREVLDQLGEQMRGQENVIVGGTEEFTINGRNAASVTGTQDNRDVLLTVAQTEEGHYVIVALTGLTGVGGQYRQLARSIAASATVNPDMETAPGN